MEGGGRAGAWYAPRQVCIIQESVCDRVTFELRWRGGNEVPYVRNLGKRIPGKGNEQVYILQARYMQGMARTPVWFDGLSKLGKEERTEHGPVK